MQEIGEPVTVKKVHPVHKSCFSRIFFGWIISFLIRSSQKNIDEKDIFDIKMSQRSAYLSSRIQNAWDNELNNEKPPSLYKALFRVFKGKLYFYGVYFMIMEFIKIGQPMLIARLVLLFDHPETKLSNTETLTYALVIVLSSFIQVLCNHNYSMGVMDLGMRIRTATCTLIYKKVLRMSKTALRESAVGQMVNLLADDVKRLDDISQNFHHIWMAPIETVIIAGLLWGYVGYTGLIGVAVMVAMTPFQVFLAKWSSKYSAKKSVKSDERVRLISEIISGIQVIKLYTWEKPFAKIVELARDQEIDKIQVALIIRAILTALSMIMSRLAVFTCIAAYVLTGNTLTATYAYTITSFYQHLRITVTIFLPQAILQLYDTRISVNRIKHFLLSEEVTKTPRNPQAVININKSATPTVNIRNANFKWFRTSPHNSLVDITFEATTERLVAVVGTVASGKTTLLHAILNEIEVESGLVEVTGSISYASQEPWLFSGSVRQNIIFGQEYDQQKYEDVIRICSLERDLSLLPKGDGTLVGERGVSLSGGQRARINLARAVYKNADIYLLDDPLSAVDAHVGEQLFKECICGYLSSKCVVLVTHQLQYLRDCRHVYLMESGGIKESGSYEELMDSNSNFARFMANYNDQEKRCEEKRRSRVEECLEMLKEYKAVEAEAEEIEIGKVSWDVYKSYLKSGETWFKCLILLLGFILYEVFGSSADCIVTIWVNLEQGFKSSETPGVWMGIKLSDKLNMEIYCTLILLFVVIAFTRTISYAKYCITTSTRLHNNMFNSIVMAPMKFFNDNSSGRIVNRFSKDMIIVDNVVPIALQDTLTLGISVIAISLIIAAMHPYLTIITTSIVVLFYYMRLAFISGSRIVKRVEAAKRSPIYDHLTASLGGMTTIRAVGAQEMLIKEFHSYQDEYSCVNFMSITVDKGFAVLLDAICIGYILCVAMSMLFVEHTSLGGTVGLTITQAIALSGMFQWGIRQWAELETQMTTVERIQEYANIPPELDENPKTPPRLWPNFGGIKFENVSMSYAPDSPYVLKQLSFEIMPQEKVGVVGRTGAGKSSLVQALFRLTKTKGSVWIDGIDTRTISLSNLRSRISIIPQEPVLFSGTLRKNLDPVEEYSDEVLWDALEQVELSQAVQNMEGRLTTKMDEGGTNLSVGQRQLVCLARAIIRNNKILVLDEATANVDPQTDSLIQKTIRRRFDGCTVITIAHRLHTIMDSDKVLVMDAGEVVEFDHPFELLQNEEGMFHGLVTRSGPALRQNLFDIAERNYRAKNAQ